VRKGCHFWFRFERFQGLTAPFPTASPSPRLFAGRLETRRLQVDADGNDLAGTRSVFLQTPIGTYTGWNLGRQDRFENGMCNLQGSFVPFAATKAERIAAGDPRLSIEERYPTKEADLSAFKKAARDLVAQCFLLPDDADSLVKTAESKGVRNAP
jgi:Alpha/beta hydrolase domain